MKKIAVVLFNLGGPDSREAIRPFLLNFFNDPNIIAAPKPVRALIARYIAWKRSRREAGDSYAMLGNKSPLLENTQVQAQALADVLARDSDARYSVHVCMRYWHPMADEVAARVAAEGPDQIILLPLYPQFSTTTTWSSFGEWDRAAGAAGISSVPTATICCYPEENGFVQASANHVREAYLRMVVEHPEMKKPRVLFSAHGLPEKIVLGGDPYQAQCEASAAAIAKATGIEELDWTVCYQSRVGPLKWIGPSTDEALEMAALDRVPVIVYPHAFVSEHVETLVEIEHEYREVAEHLGIPAFARVGTVMDDPVFINGLASMVRARAGSCGVASNTGACVCADKFKRCCMRMRPNGVSCASREIAA